MGPTLLILVAGAAADFGLSVFNTPANEIAVAYSKALDEAWIERRTGAWGADGHPSRLLHAERRHSGSWTEPAPVPFAGDGSDGDPFFDDTTETLYFTSTRPHSAAFDGESDIWRATRIDGVWQQPEVLPPPVNGPGTEYSPVRRGDRLYFAAQRDASGDLFRATEHPDGWVLERLGAALNSANGEWNVWVSADEDLLIFEASGRPTNTSPPGDLYASVSDADGRWLPAVPLTPLNGAGSELNGRLIDGKLVYASSTGRTDADLQATPLDVDKLVRDAYDKRLYVANRSSHELTMLDLASGRTLSRLSTGRGPHLLAARDGRVAVPAYGMYPTPHSEPVNTMPGWIEDIGGQLLIAAGGGAPAGQVHIELPCRRPHGPAWSADGSRLWITCEDRLGVVEVSPADPDHIRFLATGHAGAHVAAWDDPRQQLVVAHTEAGGVAFLDPASGRSRFIAVAPGSEALWLDPQRNVVWVTVGPDNRLVVLHLERHTIIAEVDPGCSFPIDLTLAADGHLWVACFGSAELVALDPGTRREVARVALPAGPLNLTSHPALAVLYASLPRHNRVVEVVAHDVPGTTAVTRSFATGMEPDGLAIH